MFGCKYRKKALLISGHLIFLNISRSATLLLSLALIWYFTYCSFRFSRSMIASLRSGSSHSLSIETDYYLIVFGWNPFSFAFINPNSFSWFDALNYFLMRCPLLYYFESRAVSFFCHLIVESLRFFHFVINFDYF
jgi:hypothetical protein